MIKYAAAIQSSQYALHQFYIEGLENKKYLKINHIGYEWFLACDV